MRLLILALLALSLAAADEAAAPPPPPIAAWDVVPHQIITAPFQAGVVAFHLRPLAVEFALTVAGRDEPLRRETVTAPTFNAQVGVWEYWLAIDPAQIPDGPFAVTATVRVADAPAVARALDPLPLYANAGGTLVLGTTVHVDGEKGDDAQPGTAEQPKRTLKSGVVAAGDGGRVLLAPGSYPADGLGGGMKRQYWTTITAREGAAREAVVITPGRPGTDKLRFAGLTLASDPAEPKYHTLLAGEQGRSVAWFDDCVFTCRKGREFACNVTGNGYRTYITGGETIELSNGPSATLMRGHRIRSICSDAFSSVRAAINCTVDEIERGKTEAHPDFCQSHVGKPDEYKSFILYNCRGLKCSSQGLFGLNLRDSAFINILFVKHPDNSPVSSQYTGRMENVIFAHMTFPNQVWHWRGKEALTRDVHFVNNIVASMSVSADPAWMAGFRFSHNLFLGGSKGYGAVTPGDEARSGAAGFADPAAGDWRPAADGPAAGSALPLTCVPADIDGKPWPDGKPDRGCLRRRD